MHIVGALPAAIYVAEREPWAAKELAILEKHAVSALQLSPPGVPYELVSLTLPAAADPRFKIHFAAIHRWSREARANACADGRAFHGKNKAPKDALRLKGLAVIWWKITNTEHLELIRQGGRWEPSRKRRTTLAYDGQDKPCGTWRR